MTAPGHNPATTPASTRSASPAVNGWQAEYLEAQYLQYKTDPSSVTADVAAFFAGFDLAQGGGGPAGGA
jgi:2-oxoglutarate dehydrogenase complex dehydrogenase (E1) component-like enzyme